MTLASLLAQFGHEPPVRYPVDANVLPDVHDAGMVRPAPLVDRLLNAHHTPDWHDTLMTTTAVALCAGPNGTARLISELINRIENSK